MIPHRRLRPSQGGSFMPPVSPPDMDRFCAAMTEYMRCAAGSVAFQSRIILDDEVDGLPVIQIPPRSERLHKPVPVIRKAAVPMDDAQPPTFCGMPILEDATMESDKIAFAWPKSAT